MKTMRILTNELEKNKAFKKICEFQMYFFV